MSMGALLDASGATADKSMVRMFRRFWLNLKAAFFAAEQMISAMRNNQSEQQPALPYTSPETQLVFYGLPGCVLHKQQDWSRNFTKKYCCAPGDPMGMQRSDSSILVLSPSLPGQISMVPWPTIC